MDWTSVFEESGDEDFLISKQLTAIPQAPRLARLVSRLYHPHSHPEDHGENILDFSEHRLFQMSSRSSRNSLGREGSNDINSAYTLQALYYLSINYILGVGCLGIPYAFARAGFLLCISILSVVTLSSYLTVMWVAETGERYHFYCQSKMVTRMQQEQQRQSTTTAPSEESPLVHRNHSNDHQDDDHSAHWDRYEVVDLVGHYLGPAHKVLYQISLMSLMYIGLLAYSQVFCSAVVELIWGPTTPTVLGLPQLVFGIMVLPLSCIELDEQISVQSIMAAVRFLAIFIMVFGSILALLLDDSNTNTTQTGPPYWAPPARDGCQMSYSACVGGFGVAFSTSLFSQLFQHSVPGLLRPLRDQPSKHSKVPVS